MIKNFAGTVSEPLRSLGFNDPIIFIIILKENGGVINSIFNIAKDYMKHFLPFVSWLAARS